MQDKINIVWFKRDLSIFDNVSLAGASEHNKIIPLYIFEPDLWLQPDVSFRQYSFLKDALHDLDKNLQALNVRLVIKVGNAVDVLEHLRRTNNVDRLWSHQETWNAWSYSRDLQVKSWAKANGIEWILNLPDKDFEIMRKNGIERINKNFAVEVIACQYIELYKDVLAKIPFKEMKKFRRINIV